MAVWPRRTRLRASAGVLSLVVVTVVLWGSSAANASVAGLDFVPRAGGPHTTFVARFIAPFGLVPYPHDSARYFLYVTGPCRTKVGLSNYDDAFVLPGDRAAILIGVGDIDRKAWCPGRYFGRITYERDRPRRVVRKIVAGFTFTVLSRDAIRRRATRPDVAKLSPQVGNPRETFVLRFTAPYRTAGEFASSYGFFGRGPGRCHRVFDTEASEQVAPGDRVVIPLSSTSIGSGHRRQWCRGRYRGHVDYKRFNGEDDVILRRRVVSNVRFTVLRR